MNKSRMEIPNDEKIWCLFRNADKNSIMDLLELFSKNGMDFYQYIIREPYNSGEEGSDTDFFCYGPTLFALINPESSDDDFDERFQILSILLSKLSKN